MMLNHLTNRGWQKTRRTISTLLHIEKLAPKTAVVFDYGKIIWQYAETKAAQ